jgi:hypothetical protein
MMPVKPIKSLVVSSAFAAGLLTAFTSVVLSKEPVPNWLEPLIPQAHIQGTGLLRVFGFRIYEATLFTDSKFDPNQWQDYALALKLHYLRDISAAQISETSAAEMRRLKLGSSTQIDDWLKQMNSLFVNVKAGDNLAGVYKPNATTVFYLNNRRLGEITDTNFGKAFFSIWFDSKTKDQSLRQALLHVNR